MSKSEILGVAARDTKSPGGDPRALDAPSQSPDVTALQVAGAVDGPGSDAGSQDNGSPLVTQRLGYSTSRS